jgi:EmrB/QacA subfamily drug resistance transporter
MAEARATRIRYEWVVATVFVAGLFMDIMDTTIVNVALPTLAREFDAGTSSIEWVVTGYLLSLAVWIPASGWIGDKIGTKRTFLFALGMFTLASALCGQAHSLPELVGFRILQGVGGGMLTPVGTAMLFRAFPPAERAKASTILIIPTVIAPALGPVLGGLLIDDLSWRCIFSVTLPIGAAAFVFGALFLREHKEATAGRFDAPGFVLSGAGLALVLFALAEGPNYGWRSTPIIAAAVAGVGAFILLVWVELRVRQPMLQLRLLGDRMFRNANLASMFSYAAFAGVLFLLPLYLQELRGLSALESGLTTFPQAIGVVLSSQIVGRLYPRVGPRRLMAIGLTGAAISVSLFAFVTLDTNLWWIRGLMFMRGVSMAYAFIPLQAATYATITPADTGRASAIYSTQRQVAAALGVAVLATVLTTLAVHGGGSVGETAVTGTGSLGAFHGAFLVAAGLSLCAAMAALLVRDEDAAATMRAKVTSAPDLESVA